MKNDKQHQEDDVFEIPNFHKYVDLNFDPILDPEGKQLFEIEMIENPAFDLSNDAKEVLRSIFRLTVKLTKEKELKDTRS